MNFIFDLGGVVLTWQPKKLIEAASGDTTIQERLRQGIFNHPDWAEYDRGSFKAAEALQRFAAHTALPSGIVRDLLDSVAPSLQPVPGTVDLMSRLHEEGHQLYCLSNMNIPAGDYIQKTWDFWPLFRGIVISCYVHLIKPDKEIFLYLLQKFSIKAEDSVFIDDTAINLETAAALGLQTLLFTDPAECRQELIERFSFLHLS